MKRFLRFLVALLLIAAAVAYVLIFWLLRDKHPALLLTRGALAVRGATIYVSPDKPPLHNATLVARDGRIVAVGTDVAVPADAQILPCTGCTITAAFCGGDC